MGSGCQKERLHQSVLSALQRTLPAGGLWPDRPDCQDQGWSQTISVQIPHLSPKSRCITRNLWFDMVSFILLFLLTVQTWRCVVEILKNYSVFFFYKYRFLHLSQWSPGRQKTPERLKRACPWSPAALSLYNSLNLLLMSWVFAQAVLRSAVSVKPKRLFFLFVSFFRFMYIQTR